MNPKVRNCPDCKTTMQPTRLIDATSMQGLHHKGVAHVDLAYAAPDAQPSAFLGEVPSLGVVRGFICPDCGRILLYGEPRRE